jgi:hypothetical protein
LRRVLCVGTNGIRLTATRRWAADTQIIHRPTDALTGATVVVQNVVRLSKWSHSRAADQLRSVGRPHQHKGKASERAPRLGHNHFATGRRQNANEPWLAVGWPTGRRQRRVGVCRCVAGQSVGASRNGQQKNTNSERQGDYLVLSRTQPTLEVGGGVRAEVAVRLLRRLDGHPAPEHASCSAPFTLLILLLPRLTLLVVGLFFASDCIFIRPDLLVPPAVQPQSTGQFAYQRPSQSHDKPSADGHLRPQLLPGPLLGRPLTQR